MIDRDRLRVMHCAAGNLYGGVEVLLKTLFKCGKLAPGLDQDFAFNFDGRIATDLADAGADVHRIGGVRLSRPWTVRTARARFRQIIGLREIDVVIAHGCWPLALYGRTSRSTGRAVVLWMHDMFGGTRAWTERLASRCVPDLVLANSVATAATLPRVFPQVWSEVLRSPVPETDVDRTEARASVRTETNTPAGDVVILTACRLEAWKGHRLLLDALGRLKDKTGWTAWVAGGAQRPHEQVYLDALRTQARELGLDTRIRFLGQRDDVPRLLAAADVHCQPNLSPEPLGLAFLEAMQAGLPVVSTRLGGAAEVVSIDCGVLVPPAEVTALAETLARLIDDPDERARLGAAGPARVTSLCAPVAVMPRLRNLLGEARARQLAGAAGAEA